MDSANKQTAVIAEATVGTTPATPAFLLARDIRVSGAPQRPNTRSPERRPDRHTERPTKQLRPRHFSFGGRGLFCFLSLKQVFHNGPKTFLEFEHSSPFAFRAHDYKPV